MTRKQQLEDMADWLTRCVSSAEADGYQEHEDEAWAEKPPTLTIEDNGQIAIKYDGFWFTAKLAKERRE